jgi:hypothetical protein
LTFAEAREMAKAMTYRTCMNQPISGGNIVVHTK